MVALSELYARSTGAASNRWRGALQVHPLLARDVGSSPTAVTDGRPCRFDSDVPLVGRATVGAAPALTTRRLATANGAGRGH